MQYIEIEDMSIGQLEHYIWWLDASWTDGKDREAYDEAIANAKAELDKRKGV